MDTRTKIHSNKDTRTKFRMGGYFLEESFVNFTVFFLLAGFAAKSLWSKELRHMRFLGETI